MKLNKLYSSVGQQQSSIGTRDAGPQISHPRTSIRALNVSQLEQMRQPGINQHAFDRINAVDLNATQNAVQDAKNLLKQWVSEAKTPEDAAARALVNKKILAAGVHYSNGALVVNSSLKLSGIDTKSLPSNLYIKGDLFIENCRSLYAIPKGLKVTGSVWAGGCDNLRSVASGTQVGEDFVLCANKNLTQVGRRLTVGKSLDVNSCLALKSIEGPIKIGLNLYAGRCPNLEAMPRKNMRSIEGDVFFVKSMQALANSQSLKDFIIEKIKTDCTVSLKGVELPQEIKNQINDKNVCSANVLL